MNSPAHLPSSPPFANPNDPHDLLLQKLEARQEAHFERLKSDLTQWLGYMHHEQQKALQQGLQEIRDERKESDARILSRFDEVLAGMEKALAAAVGSGQTGA